MAFDHPVEADRVDLSLASIMSRAPVIGSLMYLLGGQHAREEEAYVVDAALNENLDTANGQDAAPNQKPIKSALKKSSPSLAPTEDSDNESFLSATDTSERASGTSDDDSCFRRKKKELSWSDESGQNLVEYMDALEIIVVCAVGMGNSQISSQKEVPLANGFVGGSMARSRSIRQQLEESQNSSSEEKSFLPRITPHGGGVVMPSMSNHARQSPNGGIDSPQWGWYANCSITPPSPELYSPYVRTQKKVPSNSSSLPSVSENAKPMRLSSTKPNPIFQSLPSQRKDRVSHTQPTIPV